jgi:hypothetical protein
MVSGLRKRTSPELGRCEVLAYGPCAICGSHGELLLLSVRIGVCCEKGPWPRVCAFGVSKRIGQRWEQFKEA